MGKFNWRDLTRGILLGLIAGVGYLIAYLIVLGCTMNTPYFQQMCSLGWLLTIPVPAALLHFLSKQMKTDEPIEPIEPEALSSTVKAAASAEEENDCR